MGVLGIVLTYDMFNMYVFIEVTSIAAYTLIALSKNKTCLIGGLSYLVYGSVATSFVLIGIGILLFSTHTLSINHILENQWLLNHNMAIVAVFMINAGLIAKMGIFPLNFVVSRAYRFSSCFTMSYIMPVSFIAFFFAVYKFSKIVHISHIFYILSKISRMYLYLVYIYITSACICLYFR